MKHITTVFLAFLFTVFSCDQLRAQGDTCTTALLIGSGIHHADGPTTGSGIVLSNGSNCGATGSNGDWYKYIPTFTGMINITSCNTLNNQQDDDTYGHVLTGTCDSLICLGFNDDMGSNSCPNYNFATYLDIAVTAGETYYIVWTNLFDSDDFYWTLTECFGTVQGTAFKDYNDNSVRDSSEATVNTMLQVEPGGQYVYAGSDPYSFCTEQGAYTISVPNPPLYYLPVPATRTYSVNTQGEFVPGMDFAFQSIVDVYDGEANIWGWSPWIGNETHYNVTYCNIGTEPLDGEIVVTLDPLTEFVSSIPTNVTAAGQTVTWSVSNLLPGHCAYIYLTYLTDSTAIVTDTVSAFVQFNITGVEQTPENNFDMIIDNPTTSLDPNEKLVNVTSITEQEIMDEKALEYVVHFQNTGTAPAQRVIVRDVIDTDLDLSTFQMIGATHPYTIWVEGREIAWTFANIYLPDSTTELEGSQGGFSYRILANANSMPGTSITNRADIYFDYNEPVLTNTVETVVATPQAIDEFVVYDDGLGVYPSPSTGILSIGWQRGELTNGQITVFDALGRNVETQNVQRIGGGTFVNMDLSELPQGTYTVWLQGEGVNARTRFVIAR
ncbi:MAG: T9SS type A sorting domain-containing protein [Flavobacteriales bacterium]|nr:T9SS type A sorting domain-containing protein [Flavobacteriales bacterium]MBK6943732.1 T9SS type A sorting domain-containing protein [Flavobacteriales bacterium]MBK7239944.1 T9SS type A sorting domain-containing protein [Flavobacteriales bacterium]MBK9535736.1 T9SS type A sorting domain-containing protein [Flavobacteriales bacterium]MBP9138052.1 T9SS type A sorting domain-containing protein [Flavobacteriales bacterium]